MNSQAVNEALTFLDSKFSLIIRYTLSFESMHCLKLISDKFRIFSLPLNLKCYSILNNAPCCNFSRFDLSKYAGNFSKPAI